MTRPLKWLLCLGLLACSDSSSPKGESNTNWLSCDTTADCPSGQTCVAERCVPMQSVDAASPPVDAGRDSGPVGVDAGDPTLRVPSCVNGADESCADLDCGFGQICAEVQLGCPDAGFARSARCINDPCKGAELFCDCAAVACQRNDGNVVLECSVEGDFLRCQAPP